VLAPLTTFGIGGAARYFVEAKTEEDVEAAVLWAKERGLPLFVLGGGSNLLVRDSGFDGLVLRIEIGGVQQDKPWSPDFCVGAGEPWDLFVDRAIEANCAGIECLAGIPGSTGGTPVQNVGAYGQEVAQTIRQVKVFDCETMVFRWMSKDECGFRYRESVFNTTARGRYIVTYVVFSLHYGPPALSYGELKKRFEGRWRKPKLREVADAVREIRRGKGMLLVEGDPDCRSAGSFFKNPIVPVETLAKIAAGLKIERETIPNWPVLEDGQPTGMTKLPAAWLLEKTGFRKGYALGEAGISSRHTLALINRGHATQAEIVALRERIQHTVQFRFGILLEQEPVTLP